MLSFGEIGIKGMFALSEHQHLMECEIDVGFVNEVLLILVELHVTHILSSRRDVALGMRIFSTLYRYS